MANTEKMTARDFDLDSGLFSGGQGKIIDASFEPNPQEKYQRRSDSPGLSLLIESTQTDEPFPQWNSIGEKKEWKVQDRGGSVVSKTSPDSRVFNMNSRGGQVVTGMLKAIGGGDVEKGKAIVAKRGYPMTDARFYVGWDFDWKQITAEYQIDGEDVKSTFVIPVELLGEPDESDAKPRKKGGKAVEAHDLDEALVAIVADNEGLSEVKLKKLVLSDELIKTDDAYTKSVVTGNRIQFLIDEGKLAKDAKGRLTTGEEENEDEEEED